ncbi:MAG: GNAT family N-acetyltransferase [Oscillospiraceae bacterium]|nr:GNAT family N-acetyltransferase [Oscillospiraceae bacterium]
MIVPVTKENEDAWAELCVALWPENTVEDIFRERSGGRLLQNEFLYMDGGEAVAFLSLSLRRDYVEGTDSSPVGYLEGIYVKPGTRGKGVGRELTEFAKAWSRERGCSEFASDCELHNEASRAFHEKIGFREENRIICFVMDLTGGA